MLFFFAKNKFIRYDTVKYVKLRVQISIKTLQV